MSAVASRPRCRLRPRLPAVRRPARRPRRGHVRALQGVDPARARAAPFVASEGRPVRAARRRHDPGDRQRRHRLRHPRPAARRPLRDHHLPRLRRRVVGAAAVRRARRPRRDVPRPAPARAAADVRPAADRRRLRAWPRSARSPRSCSRFSFLPQVVLFVGNMLVSDSALDYFTGHLDILWKVPLAVAAARPVLRGHRCRHRVADRPADRRRRVDHRAVPGHVDRVGRSSSATTTSSASGSLAALINVLGAPAVPARPRVPRPRRPRLAAERRRQRRAARARRRTSSCSSSASAAAPSLPLGRALMSTPVAGDRTPIRAGAMPLEPTRRSSPTRRSRSPTCRCGSGRRSRCPS